MVLKVQVPDALVRGDVDEGYGAVADAFRRNFAEGREVGAACAVWRDGRPVVDLWGGYRDGVASSPWAADTLVTVFSATKGMSAAAVAVAHAQGLLDFDAPVAAYWPEFAQRGKDEVTVRQLLAHQAGLPFLDRRLDLATVADPVALAPLLAAQAPAWAPGERHGYHAVTLGWYMSELVRRVDPRGRTIGRFFAEEVAAPLDAAFFIGLPDDVPDDRLATIHAFKPPELLLHLGAMPLPTLLGMLNPRGALSRAMRLLPELMQPDAFNRRDVLAIELPAVNGTGEPRAIAHVYGEMATGGAALGLRPETVAALEQPAVDPRGGRKDVAVHLPTRYSLGYMKPFPRFTFGSSDRAYGTPGGGGSLGFADPDAGLGYCYAMNRLGFAMPVDRREGAIRAALYDVIGGRAQTSG